MHTADAQQWFSLGLVTVWLVAAVVATSGRGLGRLPSRGVLVAAGAAVVLFAAYAEVVDAVADPAPLAGVDGPTLQWMIAHRTGLLDLIMVQVSDLGGTAGMTVLTVLGVGLLGWTGRYRDAVVVAVAGAVAGPLVNVFKHLYARQRPPTATQLVFEPTYALPSGHSLSSTVVVGILTVVTVRALHTTAHRVLVVSAAAAVLVTIGVSRLYLGVHWLTDVLAGWFLGGAWLSLCVATLLLGPRRGGPSSDQARVVEGMHAGEPAPKPAPPGRAA